MSRFQCFIFFEKVKGTFENGKCQLLKMERSGYIVILINALKGPRTSFQATTKHYS